MPDTYFYPRPPRGGRRTICGRTASTRKFLSTPSARRATAVAVSVTSIFLFLSTPSARRATKYLRNTVKFFVFLSTPSARRATTLTWRSEKKHLHFYPRPPRGGRRQQPYKISCPQGISIHALREEGDALHALLQRSWRNFYPRPPRGGRRATSGKEPGLLQFLSTPSARRATLPRPSKSAGRIYFYPRPPRGGRRVHGRFIFMVDKFLSTPSARRATFSPLDSLLVVFNFYPRPPRGGRPSAFSGRCSAACDFYPRPPRGGRPLPSL